VLAKSWKLQRLFPPSSTFPFGNRRRRLVHHHSNQSRSPYIDPFFTAIPAIEAQKIANLLVQAKKPLVVTSWLGNNPAAVQQLVKLAETLSVPVLDHCPFALNFPTTHPLYQGTHWSGGGQHQMLAEADVVLVIDSDIPWIPVQNKPSPDAIVIHIDSDPLKAAMPLFYISAQHRYSVSSEQALQQLNQILSGSPLTDNTKSLIDERRPVLEAQFTQRSANLVKARTAVPFAGTPQPVPVAIGVLARCLPKDTFIVSEAISKWV
jgi:acetolactate synthase-1/2/3 large subunit